MSKPDPITEAEWAAMCDELEALGHRDPGPLGLPAEREGWSVHRQLTAAGHLQSWRGDVALA